MSLVLQEVLTLVGRLDDSPGLDTPRERFRRFIRERVTGVDAMRDLLAQSQASLGDQHARARQDLILFLGRFLGFEVSFGVYEAHAGAIRLEGQWRSRRHARIAIEIRGEQSQDADVDSLARTLAALAASDPAAPGERWVGLCVTTPLYAISHRLDSHLSQRASRDIRSISLDSLLWLAAMSAAGRVEHGDVLRLLTSGPDSDFMVDLMRRLTESAGHPDTVPPRREQPAAAEPPRLSIVARPDRDTEPRPWIAALGHDEGATPEQVLDAVIGQRGVLGIGTTMEPAASAREGDRVCFFIPGTGIVGHAQLDAAIVDASTVVRSAGRFSAVFRLRNTQIYEIPRVLVDDDVLERVSERLPRPVTTACLYALSRDEYDRLTVGFEGGGRLRQGYGEPGVASS
jgi:hypothetical protein